MTNYPECIYSNRVESLYMHFAERWCQGIGCEPFARRVILVASPHMKEWLRRKLAEDERFGIAAGLEIRYIEPALETWAAESALSSKYCPSRRAFALTIELILHNKLETWQGLSQEDQLLWQLLFQQLWGEEIPEPKSMQPRQRQRLSALSSQLAILFEGYGVYGEGLKTDKAPTKWQELLWRDLYTANPTWTTPQELLKAARLSKPKRPTVLHLFAISTLAPCYWDFITRVAEYLPVHCYHFSPCQAFWDDVTSPLQQAKLLRKIQERGGSLSQMQAFEELLVDTNPLLASWGKAGKATSNMIAGADPHPRHVYAISEALTTHADYSELIDDEVSTFPKSSLTLLEALQADIILLRTPKKPLEIPSGDCSIQIHTAPTKWREVQVLYDALVAEIERMRSLGLSPTADDIVIITPHITCYAPYLQAIFGASDSLLPIHIIDPDVLLNTPYCKAFLQILDLSVNRWEPQSILQLFEYAPFRRALNFSHADIKNIRRWTEYAAIHWGYDRDHRSSILRQDGCLRGPLDEKGTGTWLTGLHRLLEGLIMEETGGGDLFHPCSGVDSADALLLGRWMAFLEDIKNSLESCSSTIMMTVEEWVCYLQALAIQYLSAEDEVDKTAEKMLEQAFANLKAAAMGMSSQAMHFSSLRSHLLIALTENAHANTDRISSLGAIRCSNLAAFRGVPMPIIAFLGLQEGSFPRHAAPLPFDSIAGLRPNIAESDRYQFLEILLSARETFIATCLGSLQANTSEHTPSSLLLELYDYLKYFYTISTTSAASHCFYEHPLAPYHASYFNKESRIVSFSSVRYKWARAFYGQDKNDAHQFISHFSQDAVGDTRNSSFARITVGQLQSLAKAPFKDFFRNVLTASIRDSQGANTEPWMLQRGNAALLRRRALAEPWEKLLGHAVMKGEMPTMPLGSIYSDRLQLEVSQLHKGLTQLDATSDDLMTIELSDSCVTPTYKAKGHWLVPTLILELSNGKQVNIEGKITHVISRGLLAFSSKSEWHHLISNWPTFLIFCISVDTYQLPFKQHLIPLSHTASASIQCLEPCFESARGQLVLFIEYYLKCRHTPSPLQPDWVPAILKGDISALRSEIKKTSEFPQFHRDEYMQWLFRNGHLPDAEHIVDTWRPTGLNLYGAMAQGWGKGFLDAPL